VSSQARVRTLPIRLAPLAGESLDSWLFAYAVRLQTPLSEFAAATGLDDGFLRQPARSIAIGENLPDVAVTAAATAIDPVALNRLWSPLARYSRAVRGRFAGSILRNLVVPLAWSRFCPQCLATDGDRWKVTWRLPWHTTCPTHHGLLVDTCPACGARQRRLPLADAAVEAGSSGRCTGALPRAPGRRLKLCGHDLTSTPTSRGDQVAGALLLQRAAAPALAAGASDAALDAAVHVLADVSVIAAHLHSGGSAVVPGLGGPAELASSLARAWTLHGCSDDEGLASLVARDLAGGRGIMPASWRLAGPSLTTRVMRVRDASMRPTDRLRWRSTTTPRRPRPDGLGQSTARVRCCPEALWLDWAIRLMPSSGVSSASFRVMAAAALRLPGTTTPLGDLVAGTCHDGLGRKVSQALRAIGDGAQVFATLRTLTELADGLDAHGSPIDYGRRRQLVSSVELLSARDWDRICAHAGARTGHSRKLSNARLWLYETLTGGPLHSAPKAIRPHEDGVEVYHRFALRLPSRAIELLDHHGACVLANLNIDEPLTWSPPRDWVDPDGLPGPEPDGINPDRVNQMLHARVAPTVVATRLGISLDHLSHIVRRHPPEAHPRANASFRNRSPLPEDLTPERLRELVVGQGQGLRVVAREFGVDRKSIAAALEREGIPAGPAGRRPTAIDAEWLRAQYVDRSRPLPELAREIGTSTSTVAKAAKAYGIALRGPGGASHARNLGSPEPGLPSPLAEALAGEAGHDRVRRYQVLARCHSVAQAARVIGCIQATLHAQLARLERSCGALVVRSNRWHQHQRLTLVGQALLHQADDHLGRPPSAPSDLPEPLAAALASYGGDGRVRRFIEVAEADSLGQAARLLGTHQTRLSKQVLSLEASCGGSLLHRRTATNVPQRLTDLGQLLVQQATAHFRFAV